MAAGYELNTKSTTASSTGASNAAFDSSGWNINFGSGTLTASTVPSWVWLAACAAGVLWLIKRKG